MLFTPKDDYHHFGFYDSDIEYPCYEDPSICANDYCRCSRYTGVTMRTDMAACHSLFTCLYTGSPEVLLEALSFWFTKLHFKSLVLGFDASHGYYGEELSSVSISDDAGFFKKAEVFEQLPNCDKVAMLLTLEYGSVLPDVKAVRDWQAKRVAVGDILPSDNKKLNTAKLKEYEELCSSHLKYSQKKTANYIPAMSFLAPLCITSGDKYRVVDGRHRHAAILGPHTYFETVKKTVTPTGKAKAGKVKLPVEKTVYVEHDYSPTFMWIVCPT